MPADTQPPVAPKLVTSAAFSYIINPQVTVQTTLGTIVIELYPEQAPITVANMLAYTNSGFYAGTLFHRVIPGFMDQGGGFTTGMVYKTPTYAPITLESNNGLSNLRGTIAMARTNAADSATSQFFINQADNLFLNYSSSASPGYAVFGKVVSGMAVVDSISNVPRSASDAPLSEITITSVQQTTAGSSVVVAGSSLAVSGLEAGAQWSYSLNAGITWTVGIGSSFAVPTGNYAANAIQVNQTDAAGNVSVGVGTLPSAVNTIPDTVAPVVPKLVPGAAFDFLVDPQVTLHTSKGSVVIELNPEKAPATVANLLANVHNGFYDDTLFHSIQPGFVVQAGAYSSAQAYKTPTYANIAIESNNTLLNVRGSVAMLRPNTSTTQSDAAQFFIDLADNTSLNYVSAAAPGYTVFGKVVAGLSVVDSMALVPLGSNGAPVTPITLNDMAQTRAGSAITKVGTFSLSALESGAQWSYSLNGGNTWLAGSGSSLTILDGSYVATAIQVRQVDAAGNFSSTAGTAGTFGSALVVDTRATATQPLDVLAYSWKAHTLLGDVLVSNSAQVLATSHQGAINFEAIGSPFVTLSATRPVPTNELAATDSAVNLQDAIAILKMIVGLDVNGAGKVLSPYQSLAADFDASGTVNLTDAIAVLKHVVGLTSPDPTWKFVSEADATIPAKATTLSPGLSASAITVPPGSGGTLHVGLVGYLTGDVDGSYAGASGALDLDVTQPSYFQNLATATGLSLSQFGM